MSEDVFMWTYALTLFLALAFSVSAVIIDTHIVVWLGSLIMTAVVYPTLFDLMSLRMTAYQLTDERFAMLQTIRKRGVTDETVNRFNALDFAFDNIKDVLKMNGYVGAVVIGYLCVTIPVFQEARRKSSLAFCDFTHARTECRDYTSG